LKYFCFILGIVLTLTSFRNRGQSQSQSQKTTTTGDEDGPKHLAPGIECRNGVSFVNVAGGGTAGHQAEMVPIEQKMLLMVCGVWLGNVPDKTWPTWR